MAKPTLIPVSDQDVASIEELLRELKSRAKAASDAKNVVMLGVYADLVKRVSPAVQRLRARVDREDRAAINRDHKEQRKATRDQQAASA